ncbi:hypothetical protein NQ315_011535 [Exocentrus adspersus]|uniref:Uncharacterized protein n=1 Tax=Exocentrus adspersus TaxID=1586481 RepID=A0AAV8VV19_9CUCU|nr:hypothetical protein NQ315_011535 [Exocentrus adspersus]
MVPPWSYGNVTAAKDSQTPEQVLITFVSDLIFLLQLTALAEEVEVIEAISSSDESKDHPKKENESNLDQLAMESLEDQEQPPKKLAYNGPPRNPNRNNNGYHNHKPFGIQKNKPVYENKNSYGGPPPPPPKQAMDKYGTAGGGGGGG